MDVPAVPAGQVSKRAIAAPATARSAPSQRSTDTARAPTPTELATACIRPRPDSSNPAACIGAGRSPDVAMAPKRTGVVSMTETKGGGPVTETAHTPPAEDHPSLPGSETPCSEAKR